VVDVRSVGTVTDAVLPTSRSVRRSRLVFPVTTSDGRLVGLVRKEDVDAD
jgi:hypothetical protein